MFDVDPDKPDIPALARIQLWMGVFCMIASICALLLAFSKFEWVNEVFAFAAAIGIFLIALLFVGQAKILELQAVISARVKSRFAMEGMARSAMPAAGAERKPPIIPQTKGERVIKVGEQEAREQGLRLK
ncbi:MAG: hypothetical protein JNK21_09245 [Rhodospirillaceae bacterium]|nr:hypothetical protein [Rhodospirillaceae bacterium]